MFTAQKIAAVSGLITGLAAICLGAPYAYADDGNCAITAQGDTVCIRKSETQIDKDDGSTSVGPVVECSNTAPLPKQFKKPHIEF
jgi:hypothetical protein